MGVAIGKMVAEDPSFRVETDKTLVKPSFKGMGELHLDIKVDILKRTYGVELKCGQPQVAYRETITRQLKIATRTRSSLVVLVSSVRSTTASSLAKPELASPFSSTVVGGNVPKEFFPAIEKGFAGMMEKAP